MSEILKTTLAKVLAQVDPPLPYTPKPAFKPSELGSKCLRKVFYSYLRVLKDFDFSVSTKCCFAQGNAIHEWLQGLFRKSGVLIDYYQENGTPVIDKYSKKPNFEFPIKDVELEVSLKIDAILMYNHLVIGEFKSIKEKSFEKLTKPKDEHLMQGVIYFFLFNKALADGKFEHIKRLQGITKAEEVKFLYVNCNDWNQMKEFQVLDSEPIFLEALDKMEHIKDCVSKRILPAKSFEFCKECVYRKKCFNNQVGK